MSLRQWQFRLEDMLAAIQAIFSYTENMSAKEWESDRKTVDAVIRNLEIIGEAANHIPNDIQNRYNDIPWQQLRGMRNILIHEYFGVDKEILWKTVTNDLFKLFDRLKDIKTSLPPEP